MGLYVVAGSDHVNKIIAIFSFFLFSLLIYLTSLNEVQQKKVDLSVSCWMQPNGPLVNFSFPSGCHGSKSSASFAFVVFWVCACAINEKY